jgi:hypothetical protein
MEPIIELRPIALATATADNEGRLVLVDGKLAAVLTLLQDKMHAEKRGGWFLEAGLGDWAGQQGMIFATFEDVAEWLRQRIVPNRSFGSF